MDGLILPKRKGVESYNIKMCGLKREMPLCRVNKDMWLVGNENLSFGCDIAFTRKIGYYLAKRLNKFKPECLLTAEAKSLAITYEVAKHLDHKEYAIVRKGIKPCMKGCISTSIKSITTNYRQQLVIDSSSIEKIKNRRIAIIDDCISTCGTVNGLIKLAQRCKAEVEVIATIWIEGPWPFENFREQMKKGQFIYLDILPLFARGEKYIVLKERSRSAIESCALA